MDNNKIQDFADTINAQNALAELNRRGFGVDVSDGVETHVEVYFEDGVVHVTEQYEIVDGATNDKEGS
jgi:hypothetical protein